MTPPNDSRNKYPVRLTIAGAVALLAGLAVLGYLATSGSRQGPEEGHAPDGEIVSTEGDRHIPPEEVADEPHLLPFAVRGVAVDVDSGEPVSGVGVRLPDSDEEALTGGDGRFELAVQGDTPDLLLAIHPPHGWVHASVPPPERNRVRTRPGQEVRIGLQRGYAVQGIVLEADESTPVRGAVVELRENRVPVANTPIRADDAGRFRAVLVPNRPASFHVQVGRSTGEARLFAAGPPPDEIRIVLTGYTSIDGTVRNENGHPVAGARILASYTTPMPGHPEPERHWSDPPEITTEEGYYYLEGLPAGNLSVHVQPPDRSLYAVPEPVELELQINEYRRNVDFVLQRGGTLIGYVEDEEGMRITQATVEASEERLHPPFDRAPAITDDEGRFEFAPLAPDSPYTLHATAEGFAPATVEGITLDDSPVTIVMKRTEPFRFQVVEDDTGRPVPRFVYTIASSDNPDTGIPPVNVNDPEGLATPVGVVPGSTIFIHVVELNADLLSAGRRAIKEVTFTGAESEPAIVEAVRYASVTGRVVLEAPDGRRNGVPGAIVKIMPRQLDLRVTVEPPPTLYAIFHPPQGIADSAGYFALHGVQPRNYKALAEDPATDRHGEELVQVENREDVRGVEIVLETGTRIVFRAIDREGEPLVNAHVGVRSHHRGTQRAELQNFLTDAAGEAIVEAARTGRYTFILEKDRYFGTVNHTVSATAAEETVTMDFTGKVHLSGNITLNGQPLSSEDEFTVFPRTATTLPFSSRQRNRGRYEAWLDPGGFLLIISREAGGTVGVSEVDVEPEPAYQTHDADIVSASCTVALVFPSRDDFEEGLITFTPAGGVTPPPRRAYSEIVDIDLFPPGRARATFRSTSGQWTGTSDFIEVEPDGDNIFIIDVKPGRGRE